MGRGISISVLCLSLIGCASLNSSQSHPPEIRKETNSNQQLQDFSILIEEKEEKLRQAEADYHYILAETMSWNDDFEGAISELQLVLQKQPESKVIRLRLATEHMRIGQWHEAIKNIEIVLQEEPKSEIGRLLLGGIYTSIRKYDEAIHQYKALLEYHPNHLNAHLYISGLLSEQGSHEEAEDILLKILKNPENNQPHLVYYYLGRIYLERDAPLLSKATKAFEDSLRIQPNDENAMLALTRVYDLQKRHEESVALAKSFQEQFGPKEETARYLLSVYLEKEANEEALVQAQYMELFNKDDLELKSKLAMLLIKKKEFLRAAQKLEEILSIVPDGDKMRFYLALVYSELEKNKLAIENFLKVPSSSPYYLDTMLQLVTLYKLENQADKALQTMEKILVQEKDNSQLYIYQASLLKQEKGPKAAIQVLSKAIERFPENTAIRFFLGTLLDEVGQTEPMLRQMQIVIEMDKAYIPALNYLAYTYAEKGVNLNKAEELAQRALKFKPKDAYILDTMGWVLFKKGQFKEAVKHLSSAHQIKPSESVIAEHLGDAYYKLRSFEKAIRVYQRAMEVAADDKQAQKIRNKMANILANQVVEEVNKTSRSPASEDHSP